MPNLKITATTATPEQLAQVVRLFRGQAWSWTPDRPIACPTGTVTADGSPHTVLGCGSANVWPSEEPGVWDCHDCGIWFNPESETVRSPIQKKEIPVKYFTTIVIEAADDDDALRIARQVEAVAGVARVDVDNIDEL